MRAGVVGLLPGNPASISQAHAARIRELGFTGASVSMARPDEARADDLGHARAVLADHGIRVAQATASYPALVHPEPAPRAEGVRLARLACRGARLLDAVFLLIRAGSVNPAGNYAPHRDNYAPATVDRLVDSLRQVCAAAVDEGVTIGLECHAVTTLETPRRVREIIDAVGSPALAYNADPVNFVASFRDAFDTTTLLHRVFDELGRYVVSAHVKDVCLGNRLIVHLDECAPGEGVFDLATFMRLYEQHRPDGYALIEHLPDAKIPAAKQALDAVLQRAGIVWKLDA
jgi:sugar phosphate isomerase/epimerase